MTQCHSIKSAIFSFLEASGITPAVYHRELPQEPAYPVTVYDLIDDVPIGHTYDPGVDGFRRARVQIDVYAETVDEAEDIMERYVDLLSGYEGSLGVAGFSDVSVFDLGSNPDLDFEEEPTLRAIEGRSRDFQILY